MTNGTNYQPPVDQLLTFGDCYGSRNQWSDYITELGLSSQHIPDLIRMAVDDKLKGAESASLEVWAPIHAWRTLAQLGAEEAIAPLMVLFHTWEDNDWVAEEMPLVYSAIATANPPTVNALAGYLAEESHGVFPRITSVNCLQEIGKQCESLRVQCINVLTQQLKLFTQNATELNGFIVAALVELQAVESASIIYRAFVAEVVPEDIVGNWDEVQQLLGVTAENFQLVEDFVAEDITSTPVVEDVVEEEPVAEDITSTPVVEDVVVEEEVVAEDIISTPVVEDVVEEEVVAEEIISTPVVEDVVIEEEPVAEDITPTTVNADKEIPAVNLSVGNPAQKKRVKSENTNSTMIEDLLANKSSHKKTETDADKGFGTHAAKSKSKTSKKKKR
jgi:hypothetical protein